MAVAGTVWTVGTGSIVQVHLDRHPLVGLHHVTTWPCLGQPKPRIWIILPADVGATGLKVTLRDPVNDTRCLADPLVPDRDVAGNEPILLVRRPHRRAEAFTAVKNLSCSRS